VPNKTLYIREEDQETWAKAETLIPQGSSLSKLITGQLENFIAEHERSAEMSNEPFERIEVDTEPYATAFEGRWILPPDDDNRTAAEEYEAGGAFGVARTKKGKIAVYTYHINRGQGRLSVYPTFPAAIADGIPRDIIELAQAEEKGETYVRELDI
jgi:hypothetical protein